MTQEKIDLLLRKPRLYKCVNSPVYMESWEASGAHCPDKAPPPNLAQTTNTFHDTQENAGKQSALLSPHEIQKNLSPTKTQTHKQL